MLETILVIAYSQHLVRRTEMAGIVHCYADRLGTRAESCLIVHSLSKCPDNDVKLTVLDDGVEVDVARKVIYNLLSVVKPPTTLAGVST